MNMVSHVAMRTQVRPRTESEEKLRCESQNSVSAQYLQNAPTYMQLPLFSKSVHIGLVVFVAMIECDILFGDHGCSRATVGVVHRLLKLDCIIFDHICCSDRRLDG